DSNSQAAINAAGSRIAFLSNRDVTPGSPGNADLNNEIYLASIGAGGTYDVSFTAHNGVSADAVQHPFTLTVDQVPAITSANATPFTIGQPGSFTVGTTGFPLPSIARGGVALPSGVTFTDNGDGTGTLSGTPAAGTANNYALTFTATNAAGSSPVQNFTLNVVKGSQTINFTSTAPVGAKVGDPAYMVTATATSGLAVTFTLDGTSSGCTLMGSTVSLTGVGTCVIDANQAGD